MLTENTKLNSELSSPKSKTVSKKELNDLQNILSQAMNNYKKNGGKRNMITFYNESGEARRVNTKKKITTIKKRKFIPYGKENQNLDDRLTREKKLKQSNKETTQYDDDGYDVDQYTQSSEASNFESNERNRIPQDQINQEEEEEEEEELQQNEYRPRTLREKMDAVKVLLVKMEGDLDEIEDYEFSDD